MAFSIHTDSMASVKNKLTYENENENFGISTKKAASNLIDNATPWYAINSINNSFSSTDKAISSVTDTVEIIKSSEWGQEAENFKKVHDSVGTAAQAYYNQKIERIKNAWTTKKYVRIGSLVEEVSPYASDFKTASEKVTKKLTSLTAYLLDIDNSTASEGDWLALLKNGATDAYSNILSDPSVVESINELNTVKTLSYSLDSVVKVIDSIKKVIDVIEKVKPVANIAWGFATSWCSGGTSVAHAAQEISTESEKTISIVQARVLKLMKNAIFDIEVGVPEILLGSLKKISVKEAVMDYSNLGSKNNIWLNDIFDKEFYDNTTYSYAWETSITNSLDKVSSWSQEQQRKYNKYLPEVQSTYSVDTNYLKELFVNALSSEYVKEIIQSIRDSLDITFGSQITWSIGSSNSHISSSKGSVLDKLLARESSIPKGDLTAKFIQITSKSINDSILSVN